MNKKTNKQKGFTLVELAVVMVIIGILLGAILKGQQMIDNARGKRVFNDLKGLEALLWTYYDRKGRFPGDCNGTGLMGVTEGAPALNASSPTSNLDSADIDPLSFACSQVAISLDAPIADLREEQLVPWGLVNSKALLHASGGQMRISFITHSAGTNPERNAITVFDIPQWMGEMIDANIDGEINGQTGRIRFFEANPEGSAWPDRGLVERTVAIAYLFDKPF